MKTINVDTLELLEIRHALYDREGGLQTDCFEAKAAERPEWLKVTQARLERVGAALAAVNACLEGRS